MQSALPEEVLPTGEPAPNDRLDSWKEIAAYFRRDVRTVRRWEQSLGLPVHRHRHQRGVAVYAYKPEVDEWWRQRDAVAVEVAARHRTPGVGLLGWLIVATLATLGLLRSGVWRATPPRPDPRDAILSATGRGELEEYPSLSPDAQQFAFSWNGGELRNFDIYVKSLDGSPAEPLRLTSNPAADYNPTWSPDGISIAFVRQHAPAGFKVMLIPAAGGAERSVATCHTAWDRRAGSYLAWTPDGRGLMVLQREYHGQAAGLLLLSPQGIQARRLVLPLDGSPPSAKAVVGGAGPCLVAG
jgi:hypothetical protein